MTLDYGTAIVSAQKIRLMRKGNLVMLISLAVLLLNAVLALVLALTQPISFYIHGGINTIFVLVLISGIAAIVGSIMYLVGLYGLREMQPEYKTAFTCEIVLIVAGLVMNFVGQDSFLGQFLNVARSLGGVAVIWLVVQGTRHLLEGQNQEQVLRQGELVWKLHLASAVLTALLEFFPTSVESNLWRIFMLTISAVLAVFAFAVMIYYVIYLGRAAKALETAALGQKVEASEEK